MDPLVSQYLKKLRLRLLDLSGRNRLLNFKFSERSRTQLRLVNNLPDQIFEKLEKGTALTLASLPEHSEHSADEDDDTFLLMLETLRDADEHYMVAVASLDEANPDSEEFQRIERELQDRVRVEMGMSPRINVKSLSKTDYAKSIGINPDYDLPTLLPQNSQNNRQNNGLQTLLYPEELERKLAGLREGARKSLQEIGINTLYLAFGMLEWYEANQSDKRLLAPLLLYPVTLERQLQSGKYFYTVKSIGEEPEENFSLRERLRRDFDIVLPNLNHSGDPSANTIESYFENVKDVISDRSRWKVRRFVTLSLFSFGGIALFQDLNPERWPDQSSFLQHPLVSSILCGQEGVSQETIATDYDVDHTTIAKKVPLLITDTDASQFSAIADVMDGKNLVIEGPPGTGKSQTITNVIAAALAQGKTILFVAEKKAAVEVVYNRLADAGLEHYCLEVHSTGSSRQSFYERLKQRVEQEPPSDVSQDLEDQIQECSQLKQLLSRYVLLLNEPFGRIGKTIQELLWCVLRVNDVVTEILLPPTFSSLQDNQAISMTAADFQRKCQHLKVFSQQHQTLIQKYNKLENHPWFGLTAYNLSPIDQDDLLENMKIWLAVLKQLQTCSQQAVEMLTVSQQFTLGDLNQFYQQLERCPELSPLIETELLSSLKTAQAQDSVKTLVHQLRKYRNSKESLKQYFQDEMVFLPALDELKALLMSLETIGISRDPEYSIANLKDLSDQTAEISKNLEQYKPVVTQVASFFDLDSLPSLNTIETILIVVQILAEKTLETLTKRTPELCNPSNHEILIKGQVACEKLRKLRDDLEYKYYIDRCENSQQMLFYAKKLRQANLLKYWFDPEYNKAKKLWMKIRKQSTNLSDSEIAGTFERIANFQREWNSFLIDSNLRRICGQYFRDLETNFGVLISVNSFANKASQRLASCAEGEYFYHFLIQADITKLERISRLQSSKKFQALMTFVNAFKSEKEVDEQKTWEELAVYYHMKSSVSIQVYDELISFGLQPLMPISAISDLIQDVDNLNAQKQKIDTSEAINILGCFYQEERTDIERLDATINFAKSVTESQLSQSLQNRLLAVDAACVVESIQTISSNLSNCLEKEMQHRQIFFRQGKPDPQAIFGSQDVIRLRLEQIIERVDWAVANSDDFPVWVNYHRTYQQVVDDGMHSLVRAFEDDNLALDNLEDVYQVVFYRSLLRLAYQKYPELKQLSGITQAQARGQFQRADKKLLSLYQKQLVTQLAQTSVEPGNSRGVKSKWTNLALIRNEINKQRRHISQRDLFQRSSVALQQLKPCWMMSPASVAQFIPPGAVTFDILIIDEASQMRPEEALGSIARAKQLVVVGDPKQLPPTDFFKARFDQDVEEDSGEEADILDDESILDMSLKVFYPARRLKWHYRSRNESLIAFSNQHFYDNSLTIFPSPQNQFAVQYQYIETGAYRSGANVPEAMYVAEAAANFMRQYPELSLGIVTLNQKQQELLLDEMDRLFALHTELEQYRAERENTLEPFFVKNLENVQGDERDVIFISTVYGPEKPGMPVMQRFGPINSRNGHRRLNVLFTRAKERVVVFSSMKSSDIRPSPTSNRGVQILKEYLEYAQTQRLQTAVLTGREPDSDFEIFVAERLRQQGYEVVPQVGVSGYFIDLAVVDPQRPGTYLLGIECDGATYHSSKAARDRDRLRQQVLEQLGWKLYRIWSTDWFTNSTAETEKLMTYIQRLLI